MTSRKSMHEKLRKNRQRQTVSSNKDTPAASGFHRDAYHRNFEGYTEVRRLNSHGKVGIERIYTGNYYEPELSRAGRISLRILFICLIVAAAGLYAFCATRAAYCNTELYIVPFQAAEALMMLWLVYVMIFYVPTIGRMTVGDYNTIRKPLLRASLANAVCMCCTAALSLVSFLLHLQAGPDRISLLCAGGFLLSGGCIFLIHVLEARIDYRVLPSQNTMSGDGVEIS